MKIGSVGSFEDQPTNIKTICCLYILASGTRTIKSSGICLVNNQNRYETGKTMFECSGGGEISGGDEHGVW